MSTPKRSYFWWARRVCSLLGWPETDMHKLMPEYGLRWWEYFHGGLTPEQAVEKYKGPS